MKNLWVKSGKVAFWISWPLLYWYLRRSWRTRVLVVSGDQVLVIKPWIGSGLWSLPGGGLHAGESPQEGVIRELKEETGLHVVPQQLRTLFESRYRQNGLRFWYQCFVVELAEPLPPRPQRLELVEVRWVDRRELHKNNAAADVLAALHAWFKKETPLE